MQLSRSGSTALGRLAGAGMAATITIAVAAAPAQSLAQAAFSGFKHDSDLPVEVASDSLEVRNEDRMAIFRGAVDVRQGVARLRAQTLEVTYAEGGSQGGGQGAIESLRAEGDVIISNGEETAKSDVVIYNLAASEIFLIGDVLLIQGDNVISGERLRIDLISGTANIDGASTAAASGPDVTRTGDGRVQVSLQPNDE